MIDPLVSLAMSVHANPGVYAVLVGSGVSRSAGVPTGWEIVLDLIRRVAKLAGDDCEPDPESWYREKYDDDPTYSGLLDAVARSQADRSQLLRSYFEPTEQEREQHRVDADSTFDQRVEEQESRRAATSPRTLYQASRHPPKDRVAG